jgi:PAS domain S-box-containing protein
MEKGKGKSGDPGERRTRRTSRTRSEVLLAPPAQSGNPGRTDEQPSDPAREETPQPQSTPLFVHDLTSEGMHALARLLEQLRSEKGATVLLAHHLSPEHQKQLTDFLVSDAARESTETIQKLQKELAWTTELLKQRGAEIARLGDDITNILGAVHAAILVLDPEMRIIHYSPAATDLLCLEPDVRGRKLTRLELPAPIPDLEPIFANVLNTCAPAQSTVTDAAGRVLQVGIVPFMNREQKPEGAVVTFRDDEAEKRQERLLRTYQARDQQYHRVMQGILVTLDPDKNIMRINRAGSELFGKSEEEIIGRNWLEEFIPRKSAHIVSGILDRVLAGEIDDEYQYAVASAGGVEREVAWRSVLLKDTSGKVTGILSSGYDLTLLQRTQTDLHRSEERLGLMLEGLKGDEFFTMDSEGYIVSWLAHPEPGKSYDAEEMVGKHFSVLYPPDEFQSGKPMRALDSAAAQGRFEEIGMRLRKDGTRMKAEIAILPIKTAEASILGYAQSTCYLRDQKGASEAGDITFPFRLEPLYDKR